MSFWAQNPTAPRTGWILTNTGDLGPDPKRHADCEACGKQVIRYTHRVSHFAAGYHLAVGCECAELMTAQPALIKAAAAAIRNRAARLENFPTLAGWTETRGGNLRLKKDGWIFVEKVSSIGSLYYSIKPDGSVVDWERVPGFYRDRICGRRAAFEHVYPAEIQQKKRLDLRRAPSTVERARGFPGHSLGGY